MTCASYICDHRLFKNEPCRVRITVGRDKLDYVEDIGLPAANLLEIKILLIAQYLIPNAELDLYM